MKIRNFTSEQSLLRPLSAFLAIFDRRQFLATRQFPEHSPDGDGHACNVTVLLSNHFIHWPFKNRGKKRFI